MNCPVCGAGLPAQSTGRPRKYCSTACKLKAARRRAKGIAVDTKPRRPAISNGQLDDIVNGPPPGYEDSLRLVVRKLTAVMESPDTSPRDLAAVSRQLIDAAQRLDVVKSALASGEGLFDLHDDTVAIADIGPGIV